MLVLASLPPLSDSGTPMCSSEAGYQLSIFCWSWQRVARPTIHCIVLQLSSLILIDKHLNVSQICCLGVKYTGGGVNHRSWQKFFFFSHFLDMFYCVFVASTIHLQPSVVGTGCPEGLWMPHLRRHSRPGWMDSLS